MGTSRKKVIVRRQAGPPLFGYLAASSFLDGETLPLLDLEGRLVPLALAEVRIVFFVRDFNRADLFNPERLTRRVFTSRPRGHGLWVRLSLSPDHEVFEGLLPTDRTLLDSLTLDRGLFLTPPDTRLNTLRLFIPQAAVADFQVLGLIGATRARPLPSLPLDDAQSAAPELQETLFDPAPTADLPRRKVSGQ